MTSEDAYTQKYTYTQTYSTYTLSFSVSRIDLGYGSICWVAVQILACYDISQSVRTR